MSHQLTMHQYHKSCKLSKLTHAVAYLIGALGVGLLSQQVAAAPANVDSVLTATPLNHLDVFYYNQGDNFVNEVSKNLQALQPTAVKTLHEFNANDDVLTQLEQVETAATKGQQIPGTQVMAVNIVDVGNGSAVVEIAKKAQHPVIFFNREPLAQVLQSYEQAFYVGSDPTEAGHYQGEILASYLKAHPEVDLNQDGVINLVMIKGEAMHQDTQSRTQACLETLREQGVKYKILSSSSADWSYAMAAEEMDKAITNHGLKQIEAVICNNDAMALGAIAALQRFNLNQAQAERTIPVVGIDAIDAAKQAIAEGEMLGTVSNDAAGIARAIVALGQSLEQGKKPETVAGFKVEGQYVKIPYVRFVDKQD